MALPSELVECHARPMILMILVLIAAIAVASTVSELLRVAHTINAA